VCGTAAELCKKLRQEQAEMRDEAEHLNSEIRSLEADVRYSSHAVVLYVHISCRSLLCVTIQVQV